MCKMSMIPPKVVEEPKPTFRECRLDDFAIQTCKRRGLGVKGLLFEAGFDLEQGYRQYRDHITGETVFYQRAESERVT